VLDIVVKGAKTWEKSGVIMFSFKARMFCFFFFFSSSNRVKLRDRYRISGVGLNIKPLIVL